MANYQNLKSAIASVIKANGNNEITGNLLQSELLSMVTVLGAGYQFMGVANLDTVPGTPDAKVYYIAYTPGTYGNFGGIVVTGLCVLKYATAWVKEDIPISGGGVAFQTEPDDLTLETVGQQNVLKFANRASTYGMGFVILRNDSTFAEQVTESNTIYEIRYDYDLNGMTFAIPVNCILRFNGGSISNGTIVGNNTILSGDFVFDSVSFNGTFLNPELYIGPENFLNSVDLFGISKSFKSAEITLGKDITITQKNVSLIETLNINGNGHIIKIVCIAFDAIGDVKIKNCVFDCSIAESTLLHNSGTEGGFIDFVGNNTKNIEIENCEFTNIPGGFDLLYLRDTYNATVRDCSFSGNVSATVKAGGVLFFYGYRGTITAENNTIKNCDGVAIHTLGGYDENTKAIISGNYIETVGSGGIVSAGGKIYNARIFNNTIKNANYYNQTSGAANSAINFHGFKNVEIYENLIDSPLASFFDIDGSQSGQVGPVRGENARIHNNTVLNSTSFALWVVDNVVMRNNNINISVRASIIGSHIVIAENLVVSTATNGAFYISKQNDFNDHNVLIANNIISVPNANVWLDTVSNPLGVTVIRGNLAKKTDTTFSYYYSRPITYIINLDKSYYHFVKINLSKEERIIFHSYTDIAQLILSARILSTQQVNTTPIDIGFGFAPLSAAISDYGFATMSTGSVINKNAATKVDIKKQRPNADYYVYCPGGGTDADVYVAIEIANINAIEYT